MKLQNKYALVTGTSTGIGRAIAIELAKEGATVHLVARSEDKLKEIQKLIEGAGGIAWVRQCDLGKVDEINKLVDEVKNETDFRDLDILVNVAGIWHGEDKPYSGINYEDFSQEIITNTMNVGIIAPMLLCNALIPEMQHGGSIINISGTFENGSKGWLPYYVSKRAIEDFTVGLAQDDQIINKKMKINCISPSDTATEEYIKYFPEDAKDANTPEDVAKEVLNLIQSDESEQFITIKKGEVFKKGFHK